MLDKEILTIASGLYSPLFATRETIKDAIMQVIILICLQVFYKVS